MIFAALFSYLVAKVFKQFRSVRLTENGKKLWTEFNYVFATEFKDIRGKRLKLLIIII